MPHDTLLGDIGRTLSGYVAGQIKIAAILACLYALGYALSGVPYWFLIGVTSGALNVIPFVGSLLGVVLAACAVVLNDGQLKNYLGVLITFVVVQGMEGFWLTPKLLGRRVGLSPIYVFIAVLAGGAIFGPLGILLAVPVVAVLAVIWRRTVRRRATS